MKKLLGIYSQISKLKMCYECDSMAQRVKKWWVLANPKSPREMLYTYLDCCKDEVGETVNWQEEREDGKTE